MPSVHLIAVHTDVMQTHLHLSSYKKKKKSPGKFTALMHILCEWLLGGI